MLWIYGGKVIQRTHYLYCYFYCVYFAFEAV